MYKKTRLMKYENDKVTTMMNKKYQVKQPDVYSADLKTTSVDSKKLIMIVTRNTPQGCKSQKYTLLSTRGDIGKTKRELNKDFPPSIGQLYSEKVSILPYRSGGVSMEASEITLIDILNLGKTIIENINGAEATSSVPIDIYDLTCNTFRQLPSNYANMNSEMEIGIATPGETIKFDERKLSIIRIIDDYLRAENVAYGRKVKKMRRKRKTKNNR